MTRGLAAVAAAGFLFSSAACAQGPDRVAGLDWLAGEWVGEGREDGAADAEGEARLFWIPPTDGVATSLFTWNVPGDGHVHHALTVLRDVDDGVEGQGIHYGRDFETFEDNPWTFRLADMTEHSVTLECVEHCRARRVRFSLRDDGRLEERWRPLDDDAADWIVVYARASGASD